MDPSLHPARLSVEQLLNVCSIKRTRGSGPGGQHRNKVETAIVITHGPSGIVGQASEKRHQNQNREIAIERLRINLALAIRSLPKPGDQNSLSPSELWMSRVKAAKISVSPKHTDYPSLLAEALDAIHVQQFDVAAAAKSLQISTSQLVKFLKNCPAAIESVNQKRVELGLGRLK